MNVVDAALVEADGVTTPNGRTLTALVVLAAEIRRLRAAVEALGDKDRTMQIAYGADRWVKVTDVLAALEGE